MKLYTEEQVKRAIDIADENSDLLEYDVILSKLTPMKLPSYEEVHGAFDKFYQKSNDEFGLRYAYMGAFEDGAKWVIEQIKQQVIP